MRSERDPVGMGRGHGSDSEGGIRGEGISTHMRDGEVAQWLKCLPPKHEDQSLGPQTNAR